ncbi:MAG: hypothetical protein A2452_10525 [Candidatus Firestonebacteria bacterium RIFOXYC2_FULL_39_67]|nr:MAG: hypothetical protein A2452_10525 [Candidatus Firestonebacteria bacterium RIFOXYC2_FULL_39_67]
MRDIRIEARFHTFDEVAGNKDNVQMIKSILSSGRFPMGMLFTGNFGCGKTALARLVAKTLLCENIEIGQSEPCCRCNSCLWFQRCTGQYGWAYEEVNCAKEQSHEFYNDTINDAIRRGAPITEKYYIVLFDEFQRTTQPIRDKFLNALENLSPSTRFLFTAGADFQKEANPLEKIDDAFCDRVLTIHMQIPTKEEIVISLKRISNRLGLTIDESAYNLITEYSRIPRQYLGLLNKASFISNHISRDVLLAVLPKE